MKSMYGLMIGSVAAILLLLLVLVFFTAHDGRDDSGKSLHFFCAAGIKPAVTAAAEKFQQAHGVTIQFHFGGSGTLLSNLAVAKTGDLYLAADTSYTDIARDKGLIDETLPLGYMRPVIAVPRGNPKKIKGLPDLMRPDVKVVLGNPEAASIGRHTKKVLVAQGVWDQVKANLLKQGVFKPTVPEVATAIALGSADAGIIWDATVVQFDKLDALHVDALDQARKEITVCVLKSTSQPTLALRFARYLNSRVGNAIFQKNGYEPVEGDEWAWEPEITFFCGAVNRRAVDEVIERFADREGIAINTIYNGCGILTGQMQTIRNQESNKAFPDVYMACDRCYLENVKNWFQEDMDISDTKVMIAVPKGNPKGIQSLADLAKPGMRLAVGQPQQCTIGALTRMMLDKEGLTDGIMKNVVQETASSAMLVPQVITDHVDAALAYQTDTMAEKDKVDTIPTGSAYDRAIQPFSIARASAYKYIGRRLKQTLRQAKSQFEAAGFHFRGDQAK